jgi:ketosteroid isomerase-like protein
VTETIKGVYVLHRQADGSWKIAMDVWNADAPPPGAGENCRERNR